MTESGKGNSGTMARRTHPPMEKTLRFWIEHVCSMRQAAHPRETPRKLLCSVLQEFEREGRAMRYLDADGQIAWKATPEFLTELADLERDARDDLTDGR